MDSAARTGWENFEQPLNSSLAPGRLNLPSGALDALIASGDLRVISDPYLPTRLAEWSSLTLEVYENESFLLENRHDRVTPLLMEFGVTVVEISLRFLDYPPSRYEPRTDALFADSRREGLFTYRAITTKNTLRAHRDLIAKVKEICH